MFILLLITRTEFPLDDLRSIVRQRGRKLWKLRRSLLESRHLKQYPFQMTIGGKSTLSCSHVIGLKLVLQTRFLRPRAENDATVRNIATHLRAQRDAFHLTPDKVLSLLGRSCYHWVQLDKKLSSCMWFELEHTPAGFQHSNC
jgi:hypothetical protein